jgi:hypothetical protein
MLMTVISEITKKQQNIPLIGNSSLAALPIWHGHLAWQQFLAGA